MSTALFALRRLRRAPLHLVTAATVLGLGIGANLALFTLSRAFLLRPLPVPAPDRLVRIAFGRAGQPLNLDAPLFEAVLRRQQAFAGLLAWTRTELDLGSGAAVAAVPGAYVSGNALPLLGVRPRLGRLLAPADDRPGGGPDGWAVVLSDRCWRGRFGASAAALGSTVILDGVPARVVGVLEPGFTGVVVGDLPELFVPLAARAAMEPDSRPAAAGAFSLLTLGRLRPGVTAAGAAADLARLEPAALAAAVPADVRRSPALAAMHYRLEPARTGWSPFRRGYQRPIALLHALAAVLLGACCATVAGLQLARARERGGELAVRAALGAGRLHLVAPLAWEGAIVAAAGAVAGGAAALPLVRVLPAYFDLLGTPIALRLRLDWAVLLAAAGGAGLCAVLAGVLPAVAATGARAAAGLRAGVRAIGPRRRVLGRWLVPAQAAATLLLVIAAGLLSAGLARLAGRPTGFAIDQAAVAGTHFDRQPLRGDRLVALYERLRERLEAEPGMAASFVSTRPFSGFGSVSDLAAAGSGAEARDVLTHFVGPGYFHAAGTRLLAGRDLLPADLGGTPRSCIASAAAARLLFGRRSALGERLRTMDRRQFREPVVCTVVGVAEDTRWVSLAAAARPTVYLPFYGAMNQQLTAPHFVLRASDLPRAGRAFAAAFAALAPGASSGTPESMRELLARAAGGERLMAALARALAAAALALTAVGLFGLLAGEVACRRREMGIRLALGASRSGLEWAMVREGLLLVGAGAAAGLPGCIAASPLIGRFLHGASPVDPAVYGAALAVLGATAVAAAWGPARRAAHVDPVATIRELP